MLVQRYGKNSGRMFNLRFLMLKMRQITYIPPKFTHFQHFGVTNCFRKEINLLFSEYFFAVPAESYNFAPVFNMMS